MANEAKTWEHGGKTFCACPNPKCGRPSRAAVGIVNECWVCRGQKCSPEEETERRRLAELCHGCVSKRMPIKANGERWRARFWGESGEIIADVNLTPWPGTADNPECEDKPWTPCPDPTDPSCTHPECDEFWRDFRIYAEDQLPAMADAIARGIIEAIRDRMSDKPAEQSKSGIMRLPSDSPWLRDLAASIDARPAETAYDSEQREISYNHMSVDAPEPTMPDLRDLHDPRPDPIPDTYGTDAARLEDSLRYWSELDLDPAPPCGHDREHVVRGYCVACAWEASEVDPWKAGE